MLLLYADYFHLTELEVKQRKGRVFSGVLLFAKDRSSKKELKCHLHPPQESCQPGKIGANIPFLHRLLQNMAYLLWTPPRQILLSSDSLCIATQLYFPQISSLFLPIICHHLLSEALSLYSFLKILYVILILVIWFLFKSCFEELPCSKLKFFFSFRL